MTVEQYRFLWNPFDGSIDLSFYTSPHQLGDNKVLSLYMLMAASYPFWGDTDGDIDHPKAYSIFRDIFLGKLFPCVFDAKNLKQRRSMISNTFGSFNHYAEKTGWGKYVLVFSNMDNVSDDESDNIYEDDENPRIEGSIIIGPNGIGLRTGRPPGRNNSRLNENIENVESAEGGGNGPDVRNEGNDVTNGNIGNSGSNINSRNDMEIENTGGSEDVGTSGRIEDSEGNNRSSEDNEDEATDNEVTDNDIGRAVLANMLSPDVIDGLLAAICRHAMQEDSDSDEESENGN